MCEALLAKLHKNVTTLLTKQYNRPNFAHWDQIGNPESMDHPTDWRHFVWEKLDFQGRVVSNIWENDNLDENHGIFPPEPGRVERGSLKGCLLTKWLGDMFFPPRKITWNCLRWLGQIKYISQIND